MQDRVSSKDNLLNYLFLAVNTGFIEKFIQSDELTVSEEWNAKFVK